MNYISAVFEKFEKHMIETIPIPYYTFDRHAIQNHFIAIYDWMLSTILTTRFSNLFPLM